MTDPYHHDGSEPSHHYDHEPPPRDLHSLWITSISGFIGAMLGVGSALMVVGQEYRQIDVNTHAIASLLLQVDQIRAENSADARVTIAANASTKESLVSINRRLDDMQVQQASAETRVRQAEDVLRTDVGHIHDILETLARAANEPLLRTRR